MEYRLVQEILEMEEILVLQRANLKQNLDAVTKESQGFVTLQHDINLLQKMHAAMPSVIAREKDQLAGYALSLPIDCIDLFPELSGMYSQLPAMRFKGHPMANKRYYYMGQVCVAAAYRGQGVFQGLYKAHAKFFSNRFDCMVTEVSPLNKRSMAAHLNMGFEVIHEYEDESGEWCVIAWDWS